MLKKISLYILNLQLSFYFVKIKLFIIYLRKYEVDTITNFS